MKHLTIDPNEAYPSASPVRIMGALGILPHWANARDESESAQSALVRHYDYYTGPFEGCTFEPNGDYTYPGDPVQHPIAKLDVPETGEVVYFYQHAFVAVKSAEGAFWMTRMD